MSINARIFDSFPQQARPKSGAEELGLVFAKHKRIAGVAWFFDLDGTLIKATPGENHNVAADPDLQDILNRLTAQSRGALAVITGRPRIFVESLMPRRHFPSGVEHGAILQSAAHKPWERRTKLEQAALDKIRAALEERIRYIPGARVEDGKESSLTIEFTRAANPDKVADELELAIHEYLFKEKAMLGDAVLDVLRATVPGNYVIELLPQGAGKAPAVDHLMATRSFAGKMPVFCGDSAGDAGAMQRVIDLGGVAIGVGPKAPECSTVRFDDIQGLRAFLRRLVDGPRAQAPQP